MKLDEFFFLGQIVLQPATACNLNCTYCYLPSRKENLRMEPTVTKCLAESIAKMNLDYAVPLIWHGGEPLMLGQVRFPKLLEPLEKLRRADKIAHCLQTNATLIDGNWCALFKEYGFELGVSIDGPRPVNSSRRDWHENESFERIMKGLNLLKDSKIIFTCIAVVTYPSLTKAVEIYRFFRDLGCTSVGINIEERLGINTGGVEDGALVKQFWQELFTEWNRNPQVKVREFTNVLQWMGSLTGELESIPNKTDIFPTIGWNGDVVLLSPELLGAKYDKGRDFVVGNITRESLSDILESGQFLNYVQEYRAGVRQCELECKFFPYCRGGQASNKFFELGKIAGTETQHCRNSQQKPLETILAFMESSSQVQMEGGEKNAKRNS